jgi:hypothetical protein
LSTRSPPTIGAAADLAHDKFSRSDLGGSKKLKSADAADAEAADAAESRWYSEAQVKADLEIVKSEDSRDSVRDDEDDAELETVKTEDSRDAAEDADAAEDDAAKGDAQDELFSPAYNPFEHGVDNSDDNADFVHQGLSVSHDVGHEPREALLGILEQRRALLADRFASAPWNARAASRSPRRSPDHHLPIGARVVGPPRQPSSPPPPHLQNPAPPPPPAHASRGKDEHGVRIPRARGAKMHWWHTARGRAQAYSPFAEFAFMEQYKDRSAFGQPDLQALEVYRLHLQAGGSPW